MTVVFPRDVRVLLVVMKALYCPARGLLHTLKSTNMDVLHSELCIRVSCFLSLFVCFTVSLFFSPTFQILVIHKS